MQGERPLSGLTAQPRSGRIWKISGASLVLLTLLALAWLISRENTPDYILWACCLPALVGRWSYRRGLRIDSLPAEALLAQDGRPPVLYLRSFGDDGSSAPLSVGILSSWGGGEEEQIAAAMNEIGPFVAIGRPGEAMPELGASRTYQKDEDWQKWVSKMIESAQLVLFRVGKTEGFWWEVGHAAVVGKPERIVFLLPFGRRSYEQFRLRAEQHLPCKLPDFPGKEPSIWTRPLGGGPPAEDYKLQAILYFDKNWNPRIEEIKLPFYLKSSSPAAGSIIPMYAYVAPLPVTFLIKRALAPVMDQLGLTWKKPPHNRIASALLLTAALPLIFFLFIKLMS
jgi:hypothetical protein